MKKTLLTSLVLSLLLFTSCGQQGESNLPGVDGPNLSVQDGKVLLDVELENVIIEGEVVYENPALPGSSFKLTTGDRGGLELQGILDYSDIVSGNFPQAEPQLLPGGRPFPGLGSPVLYKMEVPNNDGSYLYANKNIFAVFIPADYDIQIGLRSFINVGGKSYGYAALIPSDQSGENSGVLVVLQLNQANRKQLQKLIRYSKKHSSRRF